MVLGVHIKNIYINIIMLYRDHILEIGKKECQQRVHVLHHIWRLAEKEQIRCGGGLLAEKGRIRIHVLLNFRKWTSGVSSAALLLHLEVGGKASVYQSLEKEARPFLGGLRNDDLFR